MHLAGRMFMQSKYSGHAGKNMHHEYDCWTIAAATWPVMQYEYKYKDCTWNIACTLS